MRAPSPRHKTALSQATDRSSRRTTLPNRATIMPADPPGKVIGITYDRFGDFEGFTLLTEHGTEHRFRDGEKRIEDLVTRALREHIVIAVYVSAHRHDWPSSIVLRRI
jgi:hypothetical protein